ncbi:MAG: radical SAM protein, partial [Thermodesulfobacteriota bacterium]
RFFPQYRLDRLAPTPVDTLTRFRDIALAAGIRYVYVGNVPDHEGVHTWCHHCRKLLIRRQGYVISLPGLQDGKCAFCGTAIPGVWA